MAVMVRVVFCIVAGAFVLAATACAPRAAGVASTAPDAAAPVAAAPAPAAAAVALLNAGNAAYKAGDFAGCLARYEEAMAAGAAKPETAYNAACCAARAGQGERAFALLDRAVAGGLRDRAWAEKDDDLASLRTDARWPAFLAALDRADAAFAGSASHELETIYKADQAARQGPMADIDWDALKKGDAVRRARVLELVAAGALTTGEDYFHAAMILQHGHVPDDYRQAHELALKSAELDPWNPTPRWLACAAKDRWLQSLGKPQIYGTQFKKDAAGRWTLEPIDRTAVSDAERVKWNVPTLVEADAKVERMNAGSEEF